MWKAIGGHRHPRYEFLISNPLLIDKQDPLQGHGFKTLLTNQNVLQTIVLSCITNNIKVKKKENSVNMGCVLWGWASHKKQIQFSDRYLANNSEFGNFTFFLRKALIRKDSFAKKIYKRVAFSAIRNSNSAVSKIS
jgi:hypothetical protein